MVLVFGEERSLALSCIEQDITASSFFTEVVGCKVGRLVADLNKAFVTVCNGSIDDSTGCTAKAQVKLFDVFCRCISSQCLIEASFSCEATR